MFSMGGPRHNISRYPACVNMPCCVDRLAYLIYLIKNVYLAQLPNICTLDILIDLITVYIHLVHHPMLFIY